MTMVTCIKTARCIIERFTPELPNSLVFWHQDCGTIKECVHSSQLSPRRPGWQVHVGIDPEFMLPTHVLLPGHCEQCSDEQPSSASLDSLAGPTWRSYNCTATQHLQDFRLARAHISHSTDIDAHVSCHKLVYYRISVFSTNSTKCLMHYSFLGDVSDECKLLGCAALHYGTPT